MRQQDALAMLRIIHYSLVDVLGWMEDNNIEGEGWHDYDSATDAAGDALWAVSALGQMITSHGGREYNDRADVEILES
jgi:hypothetical protein